MAETRAPNQTCSSLHPRPGMREAALAPPDTQFPSPYRRTGFWPASPSRFLRRATSAILSGSHTVRPRCVSPSRGLIPATVALLGATDRVASGTALPGFHLSAGDSAPRRRCDRSSAASDREAGGGSRSGQDRRYLSRPWRFDRRSGSGGTFEHLTDRAGPLGPREMCQSGGCPIWDRSRLRAFEASGKS